MQQKRSYERNLRYWHPYFGTQIKVLKLFSWKYFPINFPWEMKHLKISYFLKNVRDHWAEYRNFTRLPGVKILWKGSFRRVLGKSRETLQKLYLSTKFPHQKIRWSFDTLRSRCFSIELTLHWNALKDANARIVLSTYFFTFFTCRDLLYYVRFISIMMESLYIL